LWRVEVAGQDIERGQDDKGVGKRVGEGVEPKKPISPPANLLFLTVRPPRTAKYASGAF
jgi:hypothetical protein